MINIKGYEVKNLTGELLLKDFEIISQIINDKEKMQFEKWSEIFIYLGIPQEIVDEFDTADFITAIKEFNLIETHKTEIIKSFVIDDITYIAYEDDFKLTVKEMSLIEGFIKKNENRYLGDVMAVIYKRQDCDKTINYDKAHLHFKAELFRKSLTADISIPVINFISRTLINEVENINE